jgi:DNA primase
MKQSISQKESLMRAAKYYHSALPEAADYLAERGITMEAATKAGLGVVLDPLTGHEAYTNRLCIPYLTKSGVVDLRFRSLGHEEPKYMGMAGATTHLYNVGAFFRASAYICICEGEIDTITLDLVCNIPSVGVPGVNNWKKHYNRLLADFDKIFLFADGDNAGYDFGKSLSRELSNVIVIQAIQYSWMLPLGEDCTFNFFGFLRELHNVLLFSNGIKEAMELIQSTTLLMVNSSEDTLKEFLEEVTIQSNMEDLIDELEEELDKKE